MELWTLFCATNIFRKFVSTVLFKYCTCTRTCRLLYLFPSKVLSYSRKYGSTIWEKVYLLPSRVFSGPTYENFSLSKLASVS